MDAENLSLAIRNLVIENEILSAENAELRKILSEKGIAFSDKVFEKQINSYPNYSISGKIDLNQFI